MKTYSIPLPAGWKLANPFLTSEDGCERFILTDGGKIDRYKISIILENYGYNEHAKRIFLTPVQIAADDLYAALKEILPMMEGEYDGHPMTMKAIEAINKAERDPDDF